MNSALWAAKTGLDAQQTRMTVVSNNLANASTTGFKKDARCFEICFTRTRGSGRRHLAGHQRPNPLNLGTGVRVVATEKNYSQGGITTRAIRDMAITAAFFRC